LPVLTAAVVGCGRMGAHTPEKLRQSLPPGWLPLNHAEALRATPGIDLVSLCDLDPESLARAARTYGVKSCFTDYHDLLNVVRPDILAVATRTAGRCEILRAAALSGVRGIHAEKPLSTSLRACQETLAVLRDRGVWFTYGTIRRFMDVYRLARQIVAGGEIGELRSVTVEHGRELLLWGHPHSVDLLVFFGGCRDVAHVQATCEIDAAAIAKNVVDDDPILTSAFVKFSNGVDGFITTTGGFTTRLSGTRGGLAVVADGSRIELWKRPNGSHYELIHEPRSVAPTMSGTQRALAELRAAVLSGQAPSMALEDVEASQRILFEIASSSLAGGARFRLAEVDPDFTITGRFGALYA